MDRPPPVVSRAPPLRDAIPDLTRDEYLRRLERSLRDDKRVRTRTTTTTTQPPSAIAMQAWLENNPPMYDPDAYEQELKSRLLDGDVLSQDAVGECASDDDDDDFGLAGGGVPGEAYCELREASESSGDGDGDIIDDEYSAAVRPESPRLVVAPALSRVQASVRFSCCTLSHSQILGIVTAGAALTILIVLVYLAAAIYPWGA